jgi:hypothetical protein
MFMQKSRKFIFRIFIKNSIINLKNGFWMSFLHITINKNDIKNEILYNMQKRHLLKYLSKNNNLI